MKTPNLFLLLLAAASLSGCAMKPVRVAATPEYAAREPIATSLFPSDQAVLGDEAISRILSSKLELPAKAKLALMRFPGERSWRYYWRDDELAKLQQGHVDALTTNLLASDQIAEVTPLPSLMTPRQASIPLLREAAVRMQADLLLVFRVGADTYSQSRTFAKDKVKAYSTCEVVLLDVRTGLVPFTRVISRERSELKQSGDLDLDEATRRAEQGASAEALSAAAQELVSFIKAVPRKGQ